MQRRLIEVDGVRLEVIESRPTGQTVFLLHDGSSSAETFLPLIHCPLGYVYRLVAISLPGHGRSDPASSPDEAYSIPAMGRLIQRAIMRFKVDDEYVLVGHGLGGHVLTHALPGLSDASGLILINSPPASVITWDGTHRRAPASGTYFKGELTPDDIDILAKSLLGPASADASLLDQQWTAIATTDRKFRPALGASIAAGNIANEQAILRSSQVPVALIWGTEDPFTYPSAHDATEAGRWLLDGKYMLWHSGHCPHLDQRRQFSSLLNTLLTEAFASPLSWAL
jgi:pimeloyl-ACP methyl ester carboxylesterase